MQNEHWAKQQERGTKFFLSLTILIVKYCPLWLIRVTTFIVVSYFFLTDKKRRVHINDYQKKLVAYFPNIQLPKYSVFKQFLAFGESIIDRFAVWQKQIRYEDLVVEDPDNLCEDMNNSERGQILICSHLGNIEICRALISSGNHSNFKLNVLVHNRHSEIFNKALAEAGADEITLIQVEGLNAQKMLELSQKLEQGEWIAIAADRIPIQGDKTLAVNFLGYPAHFPKGAWILASLLKAPTNIIFCTKKHNQYTFKLRRFHEVINATRAMREQKIQQVMQEYADLLAKECANHPLLWFNFYDFWHQ